MVAAAARSGSSNHSRAVTVRMAVSLVVVARDEGAALADEKVEIGAVARLQHVIDVELPVTALERGLGRLPARAARGELAVAYYELQLALRHVELDLVAVAHERQRAAGGRFGRDVQHHRARS